MNKIGKVLGVVLVAVVLMGCSARTRPLIGISTAMTGSGDSRTGRHYIAAILSSGSLPVLLPIITDEQLAAETVSRLDGLVLIGGEDVEPSRYGEETIPTAGVEFIPRQDSSDFAHAKAALKAGKPILAICRGEQVMNVVLGGSLWQDLPSQRGVNHRDTVHYVDIVKESLLYKATGLERAQVNSFHHQAAKDIAPGAKITATAEDGTIEGFEYGDGQVIAVQFHPEVLAAQDTSWLSIFRYFTNLCK